MMNKIEEKFKLTVDIILCFLIVLLGIKKGGFYTSDIQFFIKAIIPLGVVYLIYLVIACIARKKISFSLSGTLLALVPIAYALPIIFKTYIIYEEAYYECLRYLSLFVVFVIVSTSRNKKFYINTFISVGISQCILGIDGLADRIFAWDLLKFRSGYLSRDLDRLSGTIQYANTAGILIAISSLFLLDKLVKGFSSYKKIILYSLSALFTLGTTCTILTKSRMVFCVYLTAMILYILWLKKDKLIASMVVIGSFLLSALACSNIASHILTDPTKIYFTVLCYMIVSMIGVHYLKKISYYLLESKVYLKLIEKRKVIFLSIAILLGMYSIVGLQLHGSISIKGDNKLTQITRQVYGAKAEQQNNITLTFDEKIEDTRYTITLYEENENFNLTQLDVFEYYDNFKDECIFNVTPTNQMKRLVLKIDCHKGEIEIKKASLNGKSIPLEYTILPSDMIFRMQDAMFGSSSIKERYEYVKDGIKIWLKHPIVGNGGEAFCHLYEQVQTYPYTSKEVHNSFVQLLLESGIIGFLSMIVLICYSIKKCKNEPVIKVALLVFVFHSIFDLNFSFHIGIIAFGILIGIANHKDELGQKKRENDG